MSRTTLGEGRYVPNQWSELKSPPVIAVYEENEKVDEDYCWVWINGPEIAGEGVEKLPEAGGSDTVAIILISMGMVLIGWGIRECVVVRSGKYW